MKDFFEPQKGYLLESINEELLLNFKCQFDNEEQILILVRKRQKIIYKKSVVIKNDKFKLQILYKDNKPIDKKFTAYTTELEQNKKTLYEECGHTVISNTSCSFPVISKRPLHAQPLNDFISAVARSVNNIVELHTHELMDKHPGLGLIYMGGSLLAGLAELPALVKLPLGGYQKFIDFLANLSAPKGSNAAVFAAAVYHGQLCALVAETIANGSDSALFAGAKSLHEDPVTIAAIILFFTGVGKLLAMANIPGISHELNMEAENSLFPASVHAYAGGKIFLALIELMENPKLTLYLKQLYKNDEITSGILARLFSYYEYLPNLNNKDKFKLEKLIRHYFSSLEAKNLIGILYQDKKESIIKTTVDIVLNYLVLSLRCLASLITWSKRPWIKLIDQIILDFTRLFLATKMILSACFNLVNGIIKTPFKFLYKSFSWVVCRLNFSKIIQKFSQLDDVFIKIKTKIDLALQMQILCLEKQALPANSISYTENLLVKKWSLKTNTEEDKRDFSDESKEEGIRLSLRSFGK